MQKLTLLFKDLSINKIPGFPNGLKPYKDFAKHINIIAGPNASGKSSTARIIKQLIWSKNTEGVFAVSSAEIDNEKWYLKLDSKSILVQREGMDENLPGLPAFEISNRYDLALHELIKDEDEDLASEIIRLSSGGYNLEDAKINLNYSDKIKARGAREYQEYELAKTNQSESESIHKELKKDEEKLSGLYEESKKAEEASLLKVLFQKLVDFLQSKFKFEQASDLYLNFPAEMSKISGKEYLEIEELEAHTEAAEKTIDSAKLKIESFEEELKKIHLPKEGVSDLILNELAERVETISEYARNIDRTEHKIEELKTEEIAALNSIDKSTSSEKWEGLDLKMVVELDHFLQTALKTKSEVLFLETGIEELKNEIVEKSTNDEILNEGIRSLSLWLKEQNNSYRNDKWLTAILAALASITAILVFFIGWPGLIGIAFIILFTLFAFRKTHGTENSIRKDDYNKTNLSQPKSWNVKNVTDKIDELLIELSAQKWQARIKLKIDYYNSEIKNLQPQFDKVNETREEMLRIIKILPDLPETDLKNYIGLYWYFGKVKEWQEAHTKTTVSIGEKRKYSESLSQALNKFNSVLKQLNFENVEDSIQAKAILNDLRNSENRRREIIAETGRLKSQIKEEENRQESFVKKRDEIYSNLNIRIGEKEKIKQLVEELESYKKAKDDFHLAKALKEEKENFLMAHSLYDANKDEISILSLDRAEILMLDYENQAKELDEIRNSINKIEIQINSTKGNNTLEAANTRKEAALDNLELLYEQNLSSLTGNLLINHLKEKSRNYNQPKVLLRANELFNHITSGRYNLLIKDEKVSSLRAYDTILKEGQDLSELSTGTRIQLLLSVRIAFIEMQEGIIKLPILADELLANSDDIRAKAIIEALIKISMEGRQIFYFTAQRDEVNKWKAFLDEEKDISFNIFELSEDQNRSFIQKESMTEISSLEFRQDIPSPEKMSHLEYGKLLKIPLFNMLLNDSEQIHIWYLTNDNQLIFKCLKKGIRKWGQLKSFSKNNGIITGLDEKSMSNILEKISLTERFIELYRRGRPRPIDRSHLEKSKAVSDNFIEEVNSKLNEFDGDPVKLIHALKNGEVNKFRTNKAEDLEQFIFDEGYVDDFDVLEKDDILIQLNALLSTLKIEDSEAQNFINNLLQPGLSK